MSKDKQILEDRAKKLLEEFKGFDKTVAEIMAEHGLTPPPRKAPSDRLPLSVRWKIGSVEFSAMGDASTVCDMAERFIKTLPDVNKTIGENSATTMKTFAEWFMEIIKNA